MLKWLGNKMDEMAEASRRAEANEKRMREEKARRFYNKTVGKFFEEVKPEEAEALVNLFAPNLAKKIRDAEYELAQHQARMLNVTSPESRESDKHFAEMRLLHAQAKLEEMKAWKAEELNKMLQYIRENNLHEFPIELKYFVIACQAGDPDALNDIMNANVLKEYLHRKQEAEVSRMEQEAEDKKVDVENKRLNLDAKRKRL